MTLADERMTLRSTDNPTCGVPRQSGGRGGFTLTELLVVIGLIVLLVTIAIPAFSIITGGRSIDSAAEPGLRASSAAPAPTPSASRRSAASSSTRKPPAAASPPPSSAPAPTPADRPSPSRSTSSRNANTSQLPNGVGVQTILNATLSGGQLQRTSDGYLGNNNSIQGWSGLPGYNNPPSGFNKTFVSYGGVILFDANGRLETKPYLFLVSEMKPVETSPGSK